MQLQLTWQNISDNVCFRNILVLDQKSDVRLLAHLGLRRELWLQTQEEVRILMRGGVGGWVKV
jgi:hypothetical protein